MVAYINIVGGSVHIVAFQCSKQKIEKEEAVMSRDGYMKDPKGTGGPLLSALATAESYW